MHCPECGAEVHDGDAFCRACGFALGSEETTYIPKHAADPRSFSEPVGATPAPPAPEPEILFPSTDPESDIDPFTTDAVLGATAQSRPVLAPDVSPTFEQPAPKRKSRAPLVVALVLLGIALAGGIAWYVLGARRQGQLGSAHPVSVSVVVDADLSGGSKVPVEVSGTTAEGTQVSEVMFVDGAGDGLALVPGTYALKLAGSPIAQDGTLFTMPTQQANVRVDEGLAAGKAVDAKAETGWRLTAIEAAKVTDEQIEDAYQLALKGGTDSRASADDLRAAAVRRRDTAMAQAEAAEAERAAEEEAARKERERQRSEEEAKQRKEAEEAASHVERKHVTFEIPEAWRGHVQLADTSSGVAIRETTYGHTLATVYASATPTGTWGDQPMPGVGVLEAVTLNGTSSSGAPGEYGVLVYYPDFPALGDEMPASVDEADGWSRDSMQYVVGLFSNGACTIDSVRGLEENYLSYVRSTLVASIAYVD